MNFIKNREKPLEIKEKDKILSDKEIAELESFVELAEKLPLKSNAFKFVRKYGISARKIEDKQVEVSVRKGDLLLAQFPAHIKNMGKELKKYLSLDRNLTKEIRELKERVNGELTRDTKEMESIKAGKFTIEMQQNKETDKVALKITKEGMKEPLFNDVILKSQAAVKIEQVIRRNLEKSKECSIIEPEKAALKNNVVMDKMTATDLNSSQFAVDLDGDGTIDVNVVLSNDNEKIHDVRDCEPTQIFKQSFEETVRAAKEKTEINKDGNFEGKSVKSQEISGFEMERMRI